MSTSSKKPFAAESKARWKKLDAAPVASSSNRPCPNPSHERGGLRIGVQPEDDFSRREKEVGGSRTISPRRRRRSIHRSHTSSRSEAASHGYRKQRSTTCPMRFGHSVPLSGGESIRASLVLRELQKPLAFDVGEYTCRSLRNRHNHSV